MRWSWFHCPVVAVAAFRTAAEATVAVAEANIDVLKAQKAEAEATGKTLQTAVDYAKVRTQFGAS